MTDNKHFEELQVDDPCYQIRCALEALAELTDVPSYKACTHLHRALLILENKPDKEQQP